MNKIIAVLFTFLVLTLPLKAEVVKNIIINGNERIPTETIIMFSSVSLNDDGTIVAIGATGNNGNGNSSGHVRVYQYDSNKISSPKLRIFFQII